MDRKKIRGLISILLASIIIFNICGCHREENTSSPAAPVNSEQNSVTDTITPAPVSDENAPDNDSDINISVSPEPDETPTQTPISNDEMSELARLYALTLDNMRPIESVDLPDDSSAFSLQLATQALSMCSQGTKPLTTKFLTSSGFEILQQENYDKDRSDPSHTCAFTLAKKQISYKSKDRNLLLIAIRGTQDGEWFSNFDFAASHSDDTAFAENFLQAAQNVYVSILPTLIEYSDALILVCGHSRGAACANLLGMTLDDMRSKENVFVYTFATPTTIRGEFEEDKYTNIFNLINPADMVTHLPLAGWGYRRVGTDIILDGDAELATQLETDMNLMFAFAPTISDYYNKRHPLGDQDAFKDGITAYETMLALASAMTGIENDKAGGLKITDIYSLAGSGSQEQLAEFYPMLNFLKLMTGNDGSMNLSVFKQHMPAVYQELMVNSL